MTLPLGLRNRLAGLILEAFHDEDARRRLETAGSGDRDEHAAEVAERAGRARRALGDRSLDPRDASLPVALGQAAVLFGARLYFEVHERLEPYWLRARGADRQALQGLIQVAVGFHHLGAQDLQRRLRSSPHLFGGGGVPHRTRDARSALQAQAPIAGRVRRARRCHYDGHLVRP